MSATYQDVREHAQRISGGLSPEEIARRLAPKHHEGPPRVPGSGSGHANPAVIDKRWALLPHAPAARAALADAASLADHERFAHNIENYIGTVKPVSYTHLTLPTNREV